MIDCVNFRLIVSYLEGEGERFLFLYVLGGNREQWVILYFECGKQ